MDLGKRPEVILITGFDLRGQRAGPAGNGGRSRDPGVPVPLARRAQRVAPKLRSIPSSAIVSYIGPRTPKVRLDYCDVMVSLAKIKEHATAGITLSMKNLFGIVPPMFYRRSDKDSYRSSFHSTEKFDKRVPRVILDLNRIRPVNLSIIDGIGTCEGGEGPWIEGIKPVRPGLLVAGKDPLATDTVAAALMGFDASGPSGQQPFIHGDNHFVLAGAAGLGCNDLSKIGIIGPSIEEARFNFEPAS